MSRSSTSSSELWAAARGLLVVWAIALAVVACAEVAARRYTGDDVSWRFWTRTVAAKHRILERMYESHRGPDTLIVGDSSAAFNLFPPALDEVLGSRSFNYGTPGNFPRSFDVVMTRGLLQEIPDLPKRMLVSFAGQGFRPEARGQTEMVLASQVARQVRGERVWGQYLGLVRLHHLLRLRREPQVHPSVFRQQGFEPYPQALQRRRRQPRLAERLPQPPAWLTRARGRVIVEDEPPLEPLRRFFEWATEHDITVYVISPPTNEPFLVEELRELAREYGIAHFDMSATRLPQHNSHLSASGARVFTTRIAQRIKDIEGP
ncbi:MAG: hypothetical protein R3F61_02705 [Myxococcota bacterium]